MDLIQPEQELVSMISSEACSENDKTAIFKLIKKFMVWDKESMLLELNPDEKSEAEFLKKFFKEWNEIKQDIARHIKANKIFWEKYEDSEKKARYLG